MTQVQFIRALLPDGSLPAESQAFVSAQVEQEAGEFVTDAQDAQAAAEAARDAALAAVPHIIVGAGRPDITGTLAPDIATRVAAAPSGAVFRSTDGPQGAWEWRKKGSAWIIVDGDTGWRRLSWWGADGEVHGDPLPAAATPRTGYAGMVAVRRIGPDLMASGQNINADGTGASRVYLPVTWRPAWQQRIPVHTSTASGRLTMTSSGMDLVSADVWAWVARTLADPGWPATLIGSPEA